MKKINLNTKIVISVLMLLGVSCKKDLLNAPPYGVQTSESYFKRAGDLDKVLTSAFAYLQGPVFISYEVTLWGIGDIGSDDAEKGSGAAGNRPELYDLMLSQQTSTNSIVATHWKQSYLSISACNLVIDKQSVVAGDATEIKNIVNQAKFLRAFNYYSLVTYFGDVPLHTSFIDPASVNLTRAPKEQVWAQIEKDLTDASELPTKSKWGAANDGRPTSGAALALLGKAYMFQKKYPEAETAFKKVIDQGEYALMPDYGAIFRKASGDYNNSESVFDIKHKTGVSGGFTGEGSFNYVFLSPIDSEIGGYGYNVPTEDLLKEFEPGDPRTIYSIVFRGDVFPKGNKTYTVSNQLSSVSGRLGRKFFIPPSEAGAVPNYQEGKSDHILRYAEVILLYAEALNENGKPAQALTYLNKVRERARNTPAKDPQRISSSYNLSYTGQLLPDVTTTDPAALRNAIWHEQRVELAMEGHRREYLVRTARFIQRMQAAKSQLGVSGLNQDRTLLPIPQVDIDLSNGLITQNKGY